MAHVHTRAFFPINTILISFSGLLFVRIQHRLQITHKTCPSRQFVINEASFRPTARCWQLSFGESKVTWVLTLGVGTLNPVLFEGQPW